MKLRCSSLPLIAACGPAIQPPRIAIEGERQAADLGTAFHEFMSVASKGEKVNTLELSHRHNCDYAELNYLCRWATIAWMDVLRHQFPDHKPELFLSATDGDIELSGHLDLSATVGDEGRILDWKTGWLETDALPQLKGYGLLRFIHEPGLKRVRLSKLQVRTQKIETEVFEREELMQWWEWFAAHIREQNTYRPGPHCGRCRRSHECEARTASIRQVAAALVPSLESQIATMAPEQIGEIVIKCRDMQKVIDRVIDAARSETVSRDGVYGPLRIKVEERRAIDVSRGFDILAEAIGREETLSSMKASKTDIEKFVKQSAPRGQKGKAVASLMQRLELAGALSLTTIEKLEVMPNGNATNQSAAIDTDDNDQLIYAAP